VNLGDTFVNRDPNHPLHLWFVCTLPNEGRVVIVNLTSADACVDRSCLITPGEHPFVTHDSLIQYQRGSVAKAEDIELAFARGLFFSRQPASDALIAKIRAGALRSEFTQGAVRKAIESCPWTFNT